MQFMKTQPITNFFKKSKLENSKRTYENINEVNLPEGWFDYLKELTDSEEHKEIKLRLQRSKATIYPPVNLLFKAFELCPLTNLKVVVLGQDPYHGQGQAMGISFSVPRGTKLPSSLLNIYKELKNDLNITNRLNTKNGDLTSWAEQGILFLNSVLTVEASKPASHRKIGWVQFTDSIIKKISDDKEGVVFVLWGNYAQEKEKFINTEKHLIIKSVHPSGLSANRGFIGSKPFSAINNYLMKIGKEEINWGK